MLFFSPLIVYIYWTPLYGLKELNLFSPERLLSLSEVLHYRMGMHVPINTPVFTLPEKDFAVKLLIPGIGCIICQEHIFTGALTYQLLTLWTWDCKAQDMLKED